MAEPQPLESILTALAAPFPPESIGWKPGAIAGNRALAMPYIDARDVMDRLDAVVGVTNWQDAYDFLSDGSVVCRLSVRLGAEWITKVDIGGQSEQPDEGDRRKAATSDALKRAAVKFGIGRFLYRLPPVWADWDPAKKRFVREPTLPGSQQSAPAPIRKPTDDPTTGKDFAAWADRLDRQLAKDGLSEPGALIDWLTSRARIEAPPLPVRWEEWPAQVVAVYVAEARKFARIRRLDREKADAAPK